MKNTLSTFLCLYSCATKKCIFLFQKIFPRLLPVSNSLCVLNSIRLLDCFTCRLIFVGFYFDFWQSDMAQFKFHHQSFYRALDSRNNPHKAHVSRTPKQNWLLPVKVFMQRGAGEPDKGWSIYSSSEGGLRLLPSHQADQLWAPEWRFKVQSFSLDCSPELCHAAIEQFTLIPAHQFRSSSSALFSCSSSLVSQGTEPFSMMVC